MKWLNSLLKTLFAESQVFVAALILGILFQGYGDDAFSMALVASLIAAVLGAPAVMLRSAGTPAWLWGGVQALQSLFAVGCAALLSSSPEGGGLAVPMLVAASVTVPALYLAAALTRYKAAVLSGLALAIIAALSAIPIARL